MKKKKSVTLINALIFCIFWNRNISCPGTFKKAVKYDHLKSLKLQLKGNNCMGWQTAIWIIYHELWAHLPRSKMAHLPGKWHICPMNFDTFAQEMAHLPRSKRAHLHWRQKYIFKKCLKSKKGHKSAKKCPKLPKKGQKGGGGAVHINQGKRAKGK